MQSICFNIHKNASVRQVSIMEELVSILVLFTFELLSTQRDGSTLGFAFQLVLGTLHQKCFCHLYINLQL